MSLLTTHSARYPDYGVALACSLYGSLNGRIVVGDVAKFWSCQDSWRSRYSETQADNQTQKTDQGLVSHHPPPREVVQRFCDDCMSASERCQYPVTGSILSTKFENSGDVSGFL